MLDTEKKLLQDFGHDIVENHLPAIIQAEIDKRLDGLMQGIAMSLFMQLKPMMITALDAEIDKLVAQQGAK